MVSSFEEVPARDRVIVALDCGIEEAFDLADQLQGKATWMKVGMTLFYANGPAIVYALKERGFKVFLDLKFHDIPHQVEGAAYAAAGSGADMLTMHTVGGVDMMAAAQKGAERAASEYGHDAPATLGITVLTSMNDAALAEARRHLRRGGVSEGGCASARDPGSGRLHRHAGRAPCGQRSRRSEPRGHACPGVRQRCVAHRHRASHHAGGRSGGCIRVHRGRAVGAPSNLRAVWENDGWATNGRQRSQLLLECVTTH